MLTQPLHLPLELLEALQDPLAVGGREEARLALGNCAVGDDVAAPRGSQEGEVGGEAVDEVGVAGDQAGDV